MRRFSSVNGVDVIDQAPAYAKIAGHNQDREVSGVAELLLADESTMFGCTTCGDVFDNVRSAISHRAAHARRRVDRTGGARRNGYPDEVVQLIHDIAATLVDDGHRFNKIACYLNDIGIPAKSTSGAWTVSTTYQLWRRTDTVKPRPLSSDRWSSFTSSMSRHGFRIYTTNPRVAGRSGKVATTSPTTEPISDVKPENSSESIILPDAISTVTGLSTAINQVDEMIKNLRAVRSTLEKTRAGALAERINVDVARRTREALEKALNALND